MSMRTKSLEYTSNGHTVDVRTSAIVAIVWTDESPIKQVLLLKGGHRIVLDNDANAQELFGLTGRLTE